MKNNLPVVILGSSNPRGNTTKAVELALGYDNFKLIHLEEYEYADYSYKGEYPEDDKFIYILKRILEFDKIIFATPIYWYSMSSVTKKFMDRISDVYYNDKDLSSKFKDKTAYLITSYADGKKETTDCMDYQFISTVKYLKMHYGASYHYYSHHSDKYLSLSNSKRAHEFRIKVLGIDYTV